MQSQLEPTFIEDYQGYAIHEDEIGAVAYMNGQPIMRSLTVPVLKKNLDVVIAEEQRHMEEYK